MPDMDSRSQTILRYVIDAYCHTGEAVGSKYIADHYKLSLSSATIRNVMGELERKGLLYSPHTSAGRLPTEKGLRFFVKFMLEVNDLPPYERSNLEESINFANVDWETALEKITTTLSGISQCAGIISAPKIEDNLKHIYFVRLNSDRALVVLIAESGVVENRVISIDPEITDGMLEKAQNYLCAHIKGLTLNQMQNTISKEMKFDQAQLDLLTQKLVEKGLEVCSSRLGSYALIVRGTANLISDADDNILNMREILQSLEDKLFASKLLDAAIEAQGVQIFIGSENPLFQHSGCAMILSPYANGAGKVLGAIGVIGPNSMHYERVVPVINYAAKLLSRVTS